ncbi:MAG: type I-E CRISPR-associated protein Cas6/Cse3/CasE [Magnetococcales bacterium]|nr:type I-E CRISPR-associated protein Cas6/Cse3/CasE [Magnetococcales bacterium]
MVEPFYMMQLQLPARLVYQTLIQYDAKMGSDDGYRLHALLVGLFGEAAPRPFCYRTVGRHVEVLGYSDQNADMLLESARLFGEPAIVTELQGHLHAKPVPEVAAGRRLGFRVNVLPTVRTCSRHFRKKGAEVDVWVAACRQQADSGLSLERGVVYANWFRESVERQGGVKVESLRLDAMRGLRLARRTAERGFKHHEKREVVFQGTLETVDAVAFRALLRRGVGRHRAFGFGMLRLSPPGPREG